MNNQLIINVSNMTLSIVLIKLKKIVLINLKKISIMQSMINNKWHKIYVVL